MSHPLKRGKRHKAPPPTWDFATKRLRGIKSDTPAERAEKDRMIREFLDKKKKARE